MANITTAGKVANSATTATSDNTIGTLVARDATGNFIANTITATLSGTASKANSLVGGSAGVLAYQTAAGTTTFTAAGTAGQVLKSTGGSAPAWTTLSTSDLTGTYNLTYATGILPSANGGTGVANTGKTITLGGNLIIAGNFTTTITSSGTTNVNLPLSGTLSTLAGTETLTNKTIIDGVANTQSTIDNSTKIATTAFVKTAISDAINEIDDEFSASYNQTEFTLSQLPAQNSKVRMYVNGSKISGAAYSVTGSKVTYYKSKNGNNNLNDARVQFEYYY